VSPNIDYVEQLSYLLFLKMADERQKGLRREQILPAGLDISWDRLTELDGSALEDEYRRILSELGKESNLGVIFRKVQNRIQDSIPTIGWPGTSPSDSGPIPMTTSWPATRSTSTSPG